MIKSQNPVLTSLAKNDLTEVNNRYPNKELIRYLERLLQSAKDGELRGMFGVFGWTGDRCSAGWSSVIGVKLMSMLGELEMCKPRFINYVDECLGTKVTDLNRGPD